MQLYKKISLASVSLFMELEENKYLNELFYIELLAGCRKQSRVKNNRYFCK